MKNTEPGPCVARNTEVDWSSLAQPPREEGKPTTPEERAAEEDRRWQEKFEQELAEEAYHDTLDAMVIHYESDPEGLWRFLTENTTSWSRYGPLEVLRLLRDHHQADVTGTDKLLLMETFMESYDYRYAYYAKCAIGNVIGHRHMQCVAVKGIRYCQRFETDYYG